MDIEQGFSQYTSLPCCAAMIDSGVCHMAIFHDPDGNTLMLHKRYAPAA